MNLRHLALTACLASLVSLPALAADHWVGTWATSPVALPNPEAKNGAAETTYREIVHISLGGDTARIILTDSKPSTAFH